MSKKGGVCSETVWQVTIKSVSWDIRKCNIILEPFPAQDFFFFFFPLDKIAADLKLRKYIWVQIVWNLILSSFFSFFSFFFFNSFSCIIAGQRWVHSYFIQCIIGHRRNWQLLGSSFSLAGQWPFPFCPPHPMDPSLNLAGELPLLALWDCKKDYCVFPLSQAWCLLLEEEVTRSRSKERAEATSMLTP